MHPTGRNVAESLYNCYTKERLLSTVFYLPSSRKSPLVGIYGRLHKSVDGFASSNVIKLEYNGCLHTSSAIRTFI